MLSAIIFFIWIFPQSLYSIISEMIISTSENDNLYFVDSGEGTTTLPTVGLSKVNQGVLLCLHSLNYTVISAMTWHYVVLVVPLTSSKHQLLTNYLTLYRDHRLLTLFSVFIICAGSKQFAKSSLFGKKLFFLK